METKKIYSSMIAIMQDVEAVKKEKQNSAQKFMFRGIDDMLNSLHGLFSKHKVFIIPHVDEYNIREKTTEKGTIMYTTHSTITFNFVAEDGSSISVTNVGEAMDVGDKGMNKAMSIALKYALIQTFLIPTEDIADPDKDTPEESVDTNLLIAIDEVQRATTIEELQVVWRNWACYARNSQFVKAIQQKQKEYAIK